jgi:cob(I)alamin adenosyltransferase
MKKKIFKDPNITINKVYTKVGDEGETYLIGGDKVLKNCNRVSAYGEVDELNSHIGSCISYINDNYDSHDDLVDFSLFLNVVQHELFNLGNMLATPTEKKSTNMPLVDKESLKLLEQKIDFYNNMLNPLKSFVLPGGHELSSRLHISRTVCRRCERKAVSLLEDGIDSMAISYLNRLSDMLFVASRWVNFLFNLNEVTWDPNYE